MIYPLILAISLLIVGCTQTETSGQDDKQALYCVGACILVTDETKGKDKETELHGDEKHVDGE